MITSFRRNNLLCKYGSYSAIFDGVNDYAAFYPFNSTRAQPNYLPILNVTSQMICSMWVKQDRTSVANGLKFLMSQASATSGNSSTNFFRLGYQTQTGAGAASNQLRVTYRANGTSNMLDSIYNLYDTNNTGITGATSSTTYWLSPSTTPGIKTNSNGFVHLCVVIDLPAINSSFSSVGVINLYWNSQRLVPTTETKIGTSQTNGVDATYSILGVNVVNKIGYHEGKIDELLATSDYYNLTSLFKTEFSLTTPQSIATFLWNYGCPPDLSDFYTTASPITNINGGSSVYRFENNWNSENSSQLYPLIPINGATFSTDHA